MKIIRAKDYTDMSRKAASILGAQVILKPSCVLGLATGSSPVGLYKELIRQYEEGLLDFSETRTANLDEYRGIQHTNDQSYYYFMRENLFSHINIREENLNIPNGENPDAAAECARYDAKVRELGGIDLQLLGMGHNGHIGFNEPADTFPLGTNCVDLQQSTIEANKRFFASADDVPRQAYTMGVGTIMGAKRIVVVVSGADKAEIVQKAFFGPITPRVPASILQLHPRVTVVADEDALSQCAGLVK